jgi:apolipoprotein N-acyltransferase
MENADAIFRRFLDLSAARTAERPDGLAGTTYLVWPETAVPYLLSKRPDALAAIGDLLPPGSFLLAGAVRSQAPVVEGDETRYYNSVYALGDDGAILAAYDKVHLVPFGEYLPFQHFLESIGLRQLTELRGGYSAGARRRTLVVGPAPPFGPLICYEIIFPGAAVAADSRPGWLLNLTNDTWFGDTPGPRQHFAQARLRAVEEGLPLVRAANSGISAVVDPYGRIDRYAGVNDVEVIDGDLPAALPPTPYARLGDLVFALLLILATGLAVYEGFTREFRRN